MHPPHGPHRISRNGQVVIPREVLAAANLEPGDSVYLQYNDAEPGSVLIVPAAVAASWFEAGRKAPQAEEASS